MIRPYNPIREQLKSGKPSRVLYDELKARKSHGLTAIEWDWFRARQQEWEPEEQARERAEASRENAMRYARQFLTTDDLRELLNERPSP
jgi:hypothetical protein